MDHRYAGVGDNIGDHDDQDAEDQKQGYGIRQLVAGGFHEIQRFIEKAAVFRRWLFGATGVLTHSLQLLIIMFA